MDYSSRASDIMKHQPPYIIYCGREKAWILRYAHWRQSGPLTRPLAGGTYRDETEAVREAAEFLECEMEDIVVMAS